MSKRLFRAIVITTILVALLGLAGSAYAAPGGEEAKVDLTAPHVAGQIVVKFKSDVSHSQRVQAHATHGGAVVNAIPQIGLQVVQVPADHMEKALAAYRADPKVVYAEPDYIAHGAFSPNDTYYDSYQYAPQIIEADLAWDITTGDSNVVVAVVDSGADFNHPDLQGKLVAGYDYVNSDSDPTDDNGHGTRVTGIAAADTNNSEGIAGIGFDTKVLVIKVLDDYNGGSYSDIAAGIIYAADQGARVINLSLGGSIDSATLYDAVEYAWNKGALLIGAAGNGMSSDPFYPAAYDHVMAVVATDENDDRWSSSNYGDWISISAPGDSIVTTTWIDGSSTYGYTSGTSDAAPHISGVAALLLARNGSLANTELRNLLESTADDLGPAGWDQYYGYGRVNAYQAVSAAPESTDNPPSASIANPADGSTLAGSVTVQVDATDAEDSAGTLAVDVSIDGGSWQTASYNSTSGYYELSWDTTAVADGSHTVDARATDSAGNTASASQVTVTTDNVDDPPSASIVNPADGSTVSGTVTVQVDATDAEDTAGSLTVDVAIDGGAWQTATWNSTAGYYELSWDTTTLTDGSHTVDARATDSTGNTANAAQVTVTTDNVDEAPSASTVNPTEGETVSGDVTVQVDASDTEDGSGSLTVEVSLDGAAWQTATWNSGSGHYELSWDTSGTSDGSCTIDARATDSAGNTASASQVSVTVDNSDYPPSASIVNPADGSTLAGTVVVQVDAADTEDGAGTLNVDVSIDGGSWQAASYSSTSGYYELSWDTTGVADGSHTVDARATDSAGNTTNASQISVTVGNTTVASTMHVGDLDGASSNFGRNWSATVTIVVVDASGDPVADAAVSGSWSGGYSGSASCTTNSNGRCGVTSGKTHKKNDSMTFTVNDVTHTELTYEPADNQDPDGDSDGTQITVHKP